MAHYKRRSRRRSKTKMLACGCCKDITEDRQAPIDDGPCTGKPHSKRKRPKKDRCPVNGTHEWVKETRVRATDWGHPYVRYTRVATYVAKLCVHCEKEVEKLKSIQYK